MNSIAPPIKIIAQKTDTHRAVFNPTLGLIGFIQSTTVAEASELIEELNACKLFTYMDRMEISRENKQKHSKEKWVDKWNKMVYNTPFNIEEKSTLTAFM